MVMGVISSTSQIEMMIHFPGRKVETALLPRHIGQRPDVLRVWAVDDHRGATPCIVPCTRSEARRQQPLRCNGTFVM